MPHLAGWSPTYCLAAFERLLLGLPLLLGDLPGALKSCLWILLIGGDHAANQFSGKGERDAALLIIAASRRCHFVVVLPTCQSVAFIHLPCLTKVVASALPRTCTPWRVSRVVAVKPPSAAAWCSGLQQLLLDEGSDWKTELHSSELQRLGNLPCSRYPWSHIFPWNHILLPSFAATGATANTGEERHGALEFEARSWTAA